MRSITAFRAALQGPDPDGVDKDAPILDDYLIVLQGQKLSLHGRVSAHPKLGTTFITTSLLIHMSHDQQWARTLSRWYRLKAPQCLEPSQVAPDTDLSNCCVVMGLEGFSIPPHLARRLMELRPDSLSRLAVEKGFDEVGKTLAEISDSWPPQREINARY